MLGFCSSCDGDFYFDYVVDDCYYHCHFYYSNLMYCGNDYDHDYHDLETTLDCSRECRIVVDFDEYVFDFGFDAVVYMY